MVAELPLTTTPHSLSLPRRVIRSGRTMVLRPNRSLGDRIGTFVSSVDAPADGGTCW